MKKGTLKKGSIAWHAAQLSAGESFLVKDRPQYQNFQASLDLSIKRSIDSGGLNGTFTVRACTVIRSDHSKLPFRCFEITREN